MSVQQSLQPWCIISVFYVAPSLTQTYQAADVSMRGRCHDPGLQCHIFIMLWSFFLFTGVQNQDSLLGNFFRGSPKLKVVYKG
jgi:hypothetical protein